MFTRAGVERAARYAFELAEQRRGLVTSATKSNASRHGYVLWDEIVREVAADFPQVRLESVLVDALAARMVLAPHSLDVVVASNLFGDILTDIGAALQGGMGMAASANIAPGASVPGIFEPVHGSAPDIVGRGIANPIGAASGRAPLMLETHLSLAETLNDPATPSLRPARRDRRRRTSGAAQPLPRSEPPSRSTCAACRRAASERSRALR